MAAGLLLEDTESSFRVDHTSPERGTAAVLGQWGGNPGVKRLAAILTDFFDGQ
jgi:hypothetical protein